MLLTLQRFAHLPEFGTFGRLTCGDLRLYTVEQDWENNQPNISCIPNGEYNLSIHESPKYGKCLIIHNENLGIAKYKTAGVPRFGCLMHPANLASQLEGCIAPGMGLGYYREQWSVRSSGKALSKIMDVLGETDEHVLTIGSELPNFTQASLT